MFVYGKWQQAFLLCYYGRLKQVLVYKGINRNEKNYNII